MNRAERVNGPLTFAPGHIDLHLDERLHDDVDVGDEIEIRKGTRKRRKLIVTWISEDRRTITVIAA
jgi:hypothetical protein